MPGYPSAVRIAAAAARGFTRTGQGRFRNPLIEFLPQVFFSYITVASVRSGGNELPGDLLADFAKDRRKLFHTCSPGLFLCSHTSPSPTPLMKTRKRVNVIGPHSH
ncbi:hypothetical protein BKA82DRAFT_580266 [Pisolithus tinctorius]|uniref:Uncharacterized protein n=1 Tax=Pisolithus tinctorius Marx 270 TaxID=870435 RepID=A0A0C3JWG7_PISTI|nr:hypothetical protein BKA82DRAFT_580266 [Pisolithus tinctorius]KIO13473.1 hypothetical protein M404DRAFT_580266 [Pisolithus tinctorius Marx 270]